MKIPVRVSPRSSRNEIVEQEDGSLKIKMTAPPVDGEANKKLIDLLAKHFGVAKSSVRIVQGEKSKNKTVEITDRQILRHSTDCTE